MSIPMIIDIAALFLLLIFVIKGISRGFVIEVLTLFGHVGGFVLAWRYAPALGKELSRFFAWSEGVRFVVSLVAIFVVINLLVALAARVIRGFLRLARLSGLDYILGAAVGLGKTFLLCLIFYAVAASLVPVVPPNWLHESRTMVLTAKAWPYVSAWLVENGIVKIDQMLAIPGGRDLFRDGDI